MTITRVGPLSCAKVMGLLNMAMGLVFGAFISLISLAGAAIGAGAAEQEGALFGALLSALFGVGAIIVFPIFYGCVGFVMTLIMAWLFNIAAGLVGGIEVDAR